LYPSDGPGYTVYRVGKVGIGHRGLVVVEKISVGVRQLFDRLQSGTVLLNITVII